METKYEEPSNGPTSIDEIITYEDNEKAMYVICSGLSKVEREKFGSLKISNGIWKRLGDVYEGNETVKLLMKLEANRRYENLNMEDKRRYCKLFPKI